MQIEGDGMKWEYLSEIGGMTNYGDVLREKGEQGWELVSHNIVFRIIEGRYTWRGVFGMHQFGESHFLTFKRPVP